MTGQAGWLYRVLDWLAAAELFTLMITVTVDVAGRYLINKPLPAGYELVQVQMGLLAFTILPALCRNNEHIALGLLDHLFRGFADRLRLFLVHGFSSAALGFLAWRVAVYARQLHTMDEGTAVLRLPFAPLGYFMASMAAVGAVALLILSVRCLRGVR